MNDWIIILEFSSADMGGRIDISVVESLVSALAQWRPVGLYHPDRYALQLQVPAASAEAALQLASSHHRAAAGGSDIRLSRAEVVSLSEFERTWDSDPTVAEQRPPLPPDGALVCTEVYDATRALLGAATLEEVTAILTSCVLAIGGKVHVGPRSPCPGTTLIDLTIVPTSPIYGSADSVSVAGMILERWLPPLVDDARHKLTLLLGTP